MRHAAADSHCFRQADAILRQSAFDGAADITLVYAIFCRHAARYAMFFCLMPTLYAYRFRFTTYAAMLNAVCCQRAFAPRDADDAADAVFV